MVLLLSSPFEETINQGILCGLWFGASSTCTVCVQLFPPQDGFYMGFEGKPLIWPGLGVTVSLSPKPQRKRKSSVADVHMLVESGAKRPNSKPTSIMICLQFWLLMQIWLESFVCDKQMLILHMCLLNETRLCLFWWDKSWLWHLCSRPHFTNALMESFLLTVYWPALFSPHVYHLTWEWQDEILQIPTYMYNMSVIGTTILCIWKMLILQYIVHPVTLHTLGRWSIV